MDQNVKDLVSCVKKVTVFHKIFVKNKPEFIDPVYEETVDNIINIVGQETVSDADVQELIAFSENMFAVREQFLLSNPDLASLMDSSEVALVLDNLKSILSTLKGE